MNAALRLELIENGGMKTRLVRSFEQAEKAMFFGHGQSLAPAPANEIARFEVVHAVSSCCPPSSG
jgi:hypothetical protein